MKIEVLRIGQRVVRDDRVTTHVALVSRAFGASRIFMNEINPEIKETVQKVNRSWGGTFEIEYVDDWRKTLREKRKHGFKIVHLTMYGESINKVQEDLRLEDSILVVVGAEKVPREVYENADYNVSVGSQPHSEISALAIVLDRIHSGRQLETKYDDAKLQITPSKRGKNVKMKSD